MSVEHPKVDGFGDSKLHSYIIFSDGETDWRHYGVLLSWSRGDPNPKTNMRKVGDEQYCREQAPLNFWWSYLINEVAMPLRVQNPTLVEDMVNGCEEAPPAERYDEDCVPESYLKGEQHGLARESAYLITKQLVKTIQVAQETDSDLQAALFGQCEKLEELIQDPTIITTAQLWERYSQQNSGHCGLFYLPSLQDEK